MRFAMAPVFYFRCGAPAVAILLKSSISSWTQFSNQT
jgi:hypothetical protein